MQGSRVAAAEEPLHRKPGEVERIGSHQERQKALLLHGVVQHASLAAVAFAREALVAHRRVADCDGASRAEGLAAADDDLAADKGHGRIRGLLALLCSLVRTTRTQCGVLHRHVRPWNSDVLEAAEAIVLVVVADLWPNVAHRDARQGLVRLHVADGHHEVVHSEVIASDEKPGVDDGVVGGPPKRPRPPLGARDSGAVDLDLVGLWHIPSGGLQAPDVAAVSELRLRVAAEHLPGLGAGEPLSLLLLAEGGTEVGDEHESLQVRAKVIVHKRTQLLRRDLQLLRQLHEPPLLLHRPTVPVRTTQVVDVRDIKHWIRLHDALELLPALRPLAAAVQQVRELARVKGGPLTLRLQGRRRGARHGSTLRGRGVGGRACGRVVGCCHWAGQRYQLELLSWALFSTGFVAGCDLVEPRCLQQKRLHARACHLCCGSLRSLPSDRQVFTFTASIERKE
mmetsp:Transcript_59245/g.185729  ORF Transcript_59245/g.185729 Transcript_59245/m.185729 type:complete len:453 (+) Transcript_59245:249-1607(+)